MRPRCFDTFVMWMISLCSQREVKMAIRLGTFLRVAFAEIQMEREGC